MGSGASSLTNSISASSAKPETRSKSARPANNSRVILILTLNYFYSHLIPSHPIPFNDWKTSILDLTCKS